MMTTSQGTICVLLSLSEAKWPVIQNFGAFFVLNQNNQTNSQFACDLRGHDT